MQTRNFESRMTRVYMQRQRSDKQERLERNERLKADESPHTTTLEYM